MPAAHARKMDRLEARLTRQQKRMIERAAQLRGTSVTDFIVQSAQQAATEAINEANVWTLRGQAQDAFVAALLNPPEPTPAAKAAAQRYKKRFAK